MNFINNPMNVDKSKQTTLQNKVIFSGVGIHNGRAVTISVEPANPNTGIVFERIDIKYNNTIKAIINNTETSKLCSKITNAYGVSVSTIEHLMAAFNGLNIDNALVKLDSSELPALDGSSKEYTNKINKIGIKTQKENRNFLRILKKISIYENDRYISVTPADEFSIDVEINYPNTIVGNDKLLYIHNKTNFIKNISNARTFAFAEDIQKMRATGLAIGGSLNNAIVVDKHKIVNSTGLRINNEFIKHKTLDCLGDFYLLGMPIIGKVTCFAPGHKINQNFIKEILKKKTNYKIENGNKYNSFNSYLNQEDTKMQSDKNVYVA
ncbi:UDP-3-O-acyl-N-acetylglucosamine deacetylase [Alphaproteobacteria bacterium]|nr:UDP-3-O-acyl-N-acetylglucosamine deacetylase [Alphaproteobacteria bacterium]